MAVPFARMWYAGGRQTKTSTECIVLVTLEIDAEGAKRILALHEGSTENATLARALLADLVGRRLAPKRPRSPID